MRKSLFLLMTLWSLSLSINISAAESSFASIASASKSKKFAAILNYVYQAVKQHTTPKNAIIGVSSIALISFIYWVRKNNLVDFIKKFLVLEASEQATNENIQKTFFDNKVNNIIEQMKSNVVPKEQLPPYNYLPVKATLKILLQKNKLFKNLEKIEQTAFKQITETQNTILTRFKTSYLFKKLADAAAKCLQSLDKKTFLTEYAKTSLSYAQDLRHVTPLSTATIT